MSDYSLMSDEELAGDGISADGAEKIAELISRYSNLVFSMAGRFSSCADYEELVSEGFDALLNAIVGFNDERGVFAAFASVCISNRMKNVADKAARRTSKLVGESELEHIQSPSPTPEELMILREKTAEMNRQMGLLLTELERRCLDGVILGMSYSDIAEKTGIDRKSVDNAVTRARAKLRAQFPDF